MKSLEISCKINKSNNRLKLRSTWCYECFEAFDWTIRR